MESSGDNRFAFSALLACSSDDLCNGKIRDVAFRQSLEEFALKTSLLSLITIIGMGITGKMALSIWAKVIFSEESFPTCLGRCMKRRIAARWRLDTCLRRDYTPSRIWLRNSNAECYLRKKPCRGRSLVRYQMGLSARVQVLGRTTSAVAVAEDVDHTDNH